MNKRNWLWIANALCLVFMNSQIGCSGSDDESDDSNGKVSYESPEKVFHALAKAMEDQDFGKAMDCMTEDGRKTMVAGLVFVGSMKAAMDKENGHKVATVLEKHGVGEKDLDEDEGKDPPKDMAAAMMEVADKVEDQRAFVTDMVNVMKEIGDDEFKNGPFGTDPKLEDIKIDGDTATAMAVGVRKGKEKKQKVDFKKVDGGWLVDFKMGGPA